MLAAFARMPGGGMLRRILLGDFVLKADTPRRAGIGVAIEGTARGTIAPLGRAAGKLQVRDCGHCHRVSTRRAIA